MRARAAPGFAWGLCALTWLGVIATLTLALLSGDARPVEVGPIEGDFVSGGAEVAFATMGALIVTRHPRNTVGWISCLLPLGLTLAFFSGEYATYALLAEPGSLPGGLLMAWLTGWIWAPSMLAGLLLLLLFPNGRPPSPRWRPVAWITLVGAIGAAFHEALSPGRLSGFPRDNPFGLGGAGGELAQALASSYVLVTIAFLASAASLVVRLRRASGDELQQLKWLASGGVVLFVAVLTTNLNLSDPLAIFAGLIVVAVAVGVSILRYRLYDIDVVINRALVYGSLTATLAGTYLGSVLLLELVLNGVTADNGLAIAGSTLAAAALFRPARRRIQATVDHRFYRRKYDAVRTIAAFGARSRDEVDLDALGLELIAVTAETMQPAHVSLWMREPLR
ncbi:MAG: hypothetical protein QOG15_1720 [Solirubrobacteraceae bacterium]|nr:hypothetical protein [Solirubrobacteraceae bacterium]